MNKLKEILLEEGTPLIPFGFASDRIKKYWTKKRDSKCDSSLGFHRRGLTNIFSSIIPIVLSLYVASALYHGTNPLNPRDYWQKHSARIEQREIQKQQEARNYSERQFHEADRNDNGVLDLDEFCDYRKDLGKIKKKVRK